MFLYIEPRSIYQRQNDSLPGAPPTPTPELHSNTGVPEIDGSPAGFIVLVVVLSAIVVVCCAGVFYLLRSNKIDRYERQTRRALAGKREDTLYQLPLGPPGIRQKFKNFFTFGKKRDGWVRASSGDDAWDASDRLVYDPPRELDDAESHWISGKDLYDAPTPARKHEDRSGPSRVERSETSDSIELSVPPSSHTPAIIDTAIPHATSREPSHAAAYTDPFSTSPITMQSPESLVSGVHPAPRDDDRRFTVQSGDTSGDVSSVRSMRKFDSGTKFKESLDF